jgi:hypothetical protein
MAASAAAAGGDDANEAVVDVVYMYCESSSERNKYWGVLKWQTDDGETLAVKGVWTRPVDNLTKGQRSRLSIVKTTPFRGQKQYRLVEELSLGPEYDDLNLLCSLLLEKGLNKNAAQSLMANFGTDLRQQIEEAAASDDWRLLQCRGVAQISAERALRAWSEVAPHYETCTSMHRLFADLPSKTVTTLVEKFRLASDGGYGAFVLDEMVSSDDDDDDLVAAPSASDLGADVIVEAYRANPWRAYHVLRRAKKSKKDALMYTEVMARALGRPGTCPTRLVVISSLALGSIFSATGSTWADPESMRCAVAARLRKSKVYEVSHLGEWLDGGVLSVKTGSRLDYALAAVVRAPDTPFVFEAGLITTLDIYDAEKELAAHLQKLARCAAPTWTSEDVASAIARLGGDVMVSKMDADQRKALEAILDPRKGVVCLLGCAGTGKTNVASAAQYLFEEGLYQPTVVAAPTGKAAVNISRRLVQVGDTDVAAYTMHKVAFGIEGATDKSVAFVDETSMADLFISLRFLKSLPNLRKLVYVGDPYQLPSVGIGAVLRDASAACAQEESTGMATVELTVNHRQGDGSLIVENARLCRSAEYADVVFDVDEKDLETFPVARGGRAALEMALEYVCARPDEEWLFLCQTRRNCELGNERLQRLYNPASMMVDETPAPKSLKLGLERVWRKGDLVMRTKNLYEPTAKVLRYDERTKRSLLVEAPKKLLVSNGGTGTIVSVTVPKHGGYGKISVKWDGVTGAPVTLQHDANDKHIVHAYAITVHKAQGSERENVAVVLDFFSPDESKTMNSLELLYTAMTRAKRRLRIFYTEHAMWASRHKSTRAARKTRLVQRLQEARDDL